MTIATNMAGRGTDILLGGNPDFMFKQMLYREEDLPDARKLDIFEQIEPTARRTNKRSSRPADCIFLGPNGMKAAASTTSSEAAPVARAILVRPVSTCRWKTT